MIQACGRWLEGEFERLLLVSIGTTITVHLILSRRKENQNETEVIIGKELAVTLINQDRRVQAVVWQILIFVCVYSDMVMV